MPNSENAKNIYFPPGLWEQFSALINEHCQFTKDAIAYIQNHTKLKQWLIDHQFLAEGQL